jgi:ABC-type uncharacterized transport system involved in gliding motility auxiliary subunit
MPIEDDQQKLLSMNDDDFYIYAAGRFNLDTSSAQKSLQALHTFTEKNFKDIRQKICKNPLVQKYLNGQNELSARVVSFLVSILLSHLLTTNEQDATALAIFLVREGLVNFCSHA